MRVNTMRDQPNANINELIDAYTLIFVMVFMPTVWANGRLAEIRPGIRISVIASPAAVAIR